MREIFHLPPEVTGPINESRAHEVVPATPNIDTPAELSPEDEQRYMEDCQQKYREMQPWMRGALNQPGHSVTAEEKISACRGVFDGFLKKFVSEDHHPDKDFGSWLDWLRSQGMDVLMRNHLKSIIGAQLPAMLSSEPRSYNTYRQWIKEPAIKMPHQVSQSYGDRLDAVVNAVSERDRDFKSSLQETIDGYFEALTEKYDGLDETGPLVRKVTVEGAEKLEAEKQAKMEIFRANLETFLSEVPDYFLPAINEIIAVADMPVFNNPDFPTLTGNPLAGEYRGKGRIAVRYDTPSPADAIVHEMAHALDMDSLTGLITPEVRFNYLRAMAEEECKHSSYPLTYTADREDGKRRLVEEDIAEALRFFMKDPEKLTARTPVRAKVLDDAAQKLPDGVLAQFRTAIRGLENRLKEAGWEEIEDNSETPEASYHAE